MGICSSQDAGSKNDQLEKEGRQNKALAIELDKEHEVDKTVSKLLLLGAGESGKSTLFKQMISIYGTGFDESECRLYVSLVYQNMVISAQVLANEIDNYGGARTDEAKAACETLKNLDRKLNIDVTGSVADAMKVLWADEGVQEAYRNRANFQLTDGTAHFFDNIDRISQKNYLPNEEDILRCRVRTTGIVENEFIIEDSKFRMFDVGGQRNERKKWIHCFENVTAVIFVAAISAYDQKLFEDENVNRMEEALGLFDTTCNSEWFKNTHIILFLNKRDLFQQKVETVSISRCFPDYKGPDKYDEAKDYICEQFEKRNKDPNKKIYTHVTCATDKGNVKHIFNSVRSIIIRQNIEEIGLLA